MHRRAFAQHREDGILELLVRVELDFGMVSGGCFHLVLTQIESSHGEGNIGFPPACLRLAFLLRSYFLAGGNQGEALRPAESQLKRGKMIPAANMCVPGPMFADEFDAVPSITDDAAMVLHFHTKFFTGRRRRGENYEDRIISLAKDLSAAQIHILEKCERLSILQFHCFDG